MTAVDVGIDEFSFHHSPFSSSKIIKGLVCGQAVSEITYLHIHECKNFSVSENVFVIVNAKTWNKYNSFCFVEN